jgi:uncharacterized protein (TIGR02996 family)
MSDDEAFIRAVVGGRGDDTPRLVYADWLDDRSDPRGAYLRAELAWAKTGKGEKKLRPLAAALDAVWVARVTRPPLGVCCDAIVIRDSRAHTTAAEIDTVEAKLNLTLPAEYRALLLNHNGGNLAFGQPPDAESRLAGYSRYFPSEVESLLPLLPISVPRRPGETWSLLEACQFAHSSAMPSPGLLNDHVLFANGGEGDLYLLRIRGKATGSVCYFGDFTHNASDPNGIDTLAKSLGAFLWSIVETTPDWYRLIRNGDRAAFNAWLDAGGDPNAEHPHPFREDTTPLSVAVDIADSATVRELVGRGAKVTPEVKRLAKFLKGPAGKAVRAALAAKKSRK